MNKYEEMNDGEITWRVHHAFYEAPEGHATICTSDYCENFNDWYKLAEKFGMTLDATGKASIPKSVSGLDEVISHTCKGRLGRAVAICFLKMKDAESNAN